MSWLFTATVFLLVVVITFSMRREIRRAKHLRLTGIRTKGVVVGQKFHLRFNRSSTYHALVVFTTQDGKRMQVESAFGMSIPMLSTGTQVSLLYEAQKPNNFLLETGLDQTSPYLGIVLIWLMAGFVLVFQMLYFT